MKACRMQVFIALCAVWILSVLGFGWYDVSSVMAELQVAPSPDLYANSLGFQVAAFVLTKGLASLLVLGVALVLAAFFRRPNRSLQRTDSGGC